MTKCPQQTEIIAFEIARKKTLVAILFNIFESTIHGKSKHGKHDWSLPGENHSVIKEKNCISMQNLLACS